MFEDLNNVEVLRVVIISDFLKYLKNCSTTGT
jgi:hypothetical protein